MYPLFKLVLNCTYSFVKLSTLIFQYIVILCCKNNIFESVHINTTALGATGVSTLLVISKRRSIWVSVLVNMKILLLYFRGKDLVLGIARNLNLHMQGTLF